MNALYKHDLTIREFAASVKIKYNTVRPWINKQLALDKANAEVEAATATAQATAPAPIPPSNTESIPNPNLPPQFSAGSKQEYPGKMKDAFDRYSKSSKDKKAVDPDVENKVYEWFSKRKATRTVLFDEIRLAYQVFYDEKYPEKYQSRVQRGADHEEIAIPRIQRFLKRKKITNRKCHGECKDADWEAAKAFRLKNAHPEFHDWTAEKFRKMVLEGRLYNADEAGLFWELFFKGKSLTRDGVKSDIYGDSIPKKRYTFTVCVSCDGRLLTPQIITTNKNHRPAVQAGVCRPEDWIASQF